MTSDAETAIMHDVLDLVRRKLPVRKDELSIQQALSNFGVSSLGYIELIVELERRYSIRFSDDQISGDALHTIQGICSAIQMALPIRSATLK